jgi:hypothetical protein
MATRLRIPASLAVSLAGLGIASCIDPALADAGDAMNTLNCDSVCRAQQTVYLQSCTPVSSDTGLVCVSTTDGGGTFCAVTTPVTTTNGACCCEPVA